MTDPECVALLQWAAPRLGLRWDGFRRVRGQVCKRIARRIRGLGLADAEAYRVRLGDDSEEWRRLDALCRVTISRFFRDREVFERLAAEVLPALVERARAAGRPLRCWSAGCASGEEPWSLALLLRFSLGGVEARIQATDADASLLERARAACYQRGTLRELPEEWVEEAFEERDGLLCLRPRLREGVELRCEDLRDRMPAGPFELVLCRNLAFTYFAPRLQRTMLDRLIDRLAPGGALVIGSHEQLPEDDRLSQLGHLPIYRLNGFVGPAELPGR